MGHQTVRNDGLFIGPALNQITLPARDYAASVAFYKQMGLTQIVAGPDNRYARFEAANGVTLSIHVGEGTAGGPTTYLESGDRKSVGRGRSVSVRVELGGRSKLKKKKRKTK